MADELLWGVKNGDLDAVKKSCEKAGFDVNAELLNGRNPLHYASDYGQVEVIKYLLTKGAEIDLPDKHGITALLAAIFEGHTECVQLLISKGANKEGKSPDGTAYRDCAETDEIKDLLK